MGGPADWLIEILPWRAGAAAAVGQDPIDVTDRAILDELGTINRAVERDFLSFRTGDLTLGLLNDDGALDTLFGLFGATDRWQLRVARRGKVIFLGIIMGQDSVTFDELERTVEITAYGATKVLDETSAESLKRTIPDMTMGAALAGITALTLNTTAGLLPGDVLHITDHNNKEDVTVKYVVSATVVNLVAATSNAYPGASNEVSCTTPYYRFKSIDFLVRALFTAAAISLAELRLGQSQLSSIGPTQLSVGGLGTTKVLLSGACERNGRAYANLDTLGAYYQALDATDSDWTNEDATNRPWIDWSRYRMQSQGPPDVILRAPDPIHTDDCEAFALGIDDRGATKIAYRTSGTGGVINVDKNTTVDGTTWTGWVNLYTNIIGDGGYQLGTGAEFDPVRNQVYFTRYGQGGAHPNSFMYDVGGATKTDLSFGSATGYQGFRYIPEKDYTLALYGNINQPSHVAAFRNGVELWRRALPTNLVNWVTGSPPVDALPTGATALGNTHMITHGARWINGRIYMLCFRDGVVNLLSTADDFVTIRVSSIGQPGRVVNAAIPARVNGAYYFWLYSVAAPAATDKRYYIAAPFYAGVVEYADFTAKSCAEALQEIATITKAFFWVDDNFEAHVVARDQVPAGDMPDLTERDLVIEQSEIQVWGESRQYVEVSGGGFSARAGDPNFAADAATLSSDLIPNGAYAQAMADDLYDFLKKRRAVLDSPVIDEEGLELHPMRRAIVDGRRFYVQESDHDPVNDEWSVRFLEDLENQPAA